MYLRGFSEAAAALGNLAGDSSENHFDKQVGGLYSIFLVEEGKYVDLVLKA